MARPRPTPSVAAQLDALYAEVPTIDCQGLCWDSCGRIDMSNAERRRIQAERGVDIPDGTKAAEVREPWSTPERAAAAAAALREQRRQWSLEYEVRTTLARRNGTALYVSGRGVLAKTSPHRGDR